MTLKALLVAAGAASLIAGAAYAQSTDGPSAVDAQGNVITTTETVDPNTGVTVETTADADVRGHMEGTPAPMGTVTTGAYSATTVGTPASSYAVTTSGVPGTVTTRTITNGPVPDTAENRAKYGQPLSHAGKRTAPAGN